MTASFREDSGRQYRAPVFDMGAGFAPIHRSGEVQHRMGAAGQHKGRHHEKNKPGPCHRILDPHNHDLPLSCGYVLSSFHRKNKNETGSNFSRSHPLQLTDRLFNLSVMSLDTAYAALYLASDEAAYATGVVMPVDGGLSTRMG